MKPLHLVGLAAITLLLVYTIVDGVAQEPTRLTREEYVTIRWAGRDNTHIIRNGQVEFIGTELRKVVKPDRTDERSFYMNLAMNGLAKEGFEFAGIFNDDIIMKRSIGR
ncbi:MAG: hypothetical protein ACK4UN_21890 [Limisphaerales bacterium]